MIVLHLFPLFGLLFSPQEKPEESLRDMVPADDLQVRLFAGEPTIFNPTCLDVDEKGRVWICEGVNYRGAAGPQSPEPPYFRAPARKTGDRIVILEDTDGDGKADASRVFYEGLDIQAPLGIAVIGDKVWISQAPDVFTLEIRPDGTAGKKEVVLTGFGGLNHDHGVHSFFLGPDGKLYGCFGNNGAAVTFPDGRKLVTDGKPFHGGCVFRANLDLTGLEVLAHNFRNEYEAAVDSFGTAFSKDNDDDGNQWVRFTYVMEGANFGYVGPRGAHWHMETPGMLPGLMRTGAGSPTGICIYEGALLPEKYRGIPIQADAGPGVIEAYPLTPDGAGYRVKGAAVDAEGRQTIQTWSEIRKPEIILSCKDRWFRPSDVCAAPDGSLFIADWYDPGVGGHGMKDPDSGRIYRILPKNHDGSYRVPPIDLSTPEGLIQALRSPALSVRARAILRLREMGAQAIPILVPHAKSADRVLRARVLQQLGALGPDGERFIREALRDADPDFRILALRILRRVGADKVETARPLLNDPSAQVRRELLLSLRDADPARAAEMLVALANQYDGYDRFYLEAVAIAFRGRESVLVPALIESWKGTWDKRIAGLLWGLHPPQALDLISSVLSDEKRGLADRADAVEALGGIDDPAAGSRVAALLAPQTPAELTKRALEALSRNLQGPWAALRRDPTLKEALLRGHENDAFHAAAVKAYGAFLGARPLARWKLSPLHPKGFAAAHPPEQANEPEREKGWDPAKIPPDGTVDLVAARPGTGVTYAVTLIGVQKAWDTNLLVGSDRALRIWVNRKLVHENRTERKRALRQDIVPVSFDQGLNTVLVKLDQESAPCSFVIEVEDPDRRTSEKSLRPVPGSPSSSDRLDPKRLPLPAELLSRPGDAARGRDVFYRSDVTCAKCHRIKGEGGEIGTDLSAIGTKGGKDALLNSLLRPSDAVAPEFTAWLVNSKNRGPVSGLLVEKTAEKLVLKDAEGELITVKSGDIIEAKPSEFSLMPPDLVGTLTRQELADLLEFLAALK